MKGITQLFAISSLSLVLSGCWLDSDNDTIETPEPAPAPPPAAADTFVRVTHAVSDAPGVNVLAGGDILAGLENVDYQVSSPWITLEEGSYSVQVDAILPDQSTTAVIGPVDLDLVGDTTYDVLAIGTVETIEPLIIENTFTEVTSGSARVQVVHAAPNAPMVDIYVTAPGDDLSSAQALATLSYREFTGQAEVAEGDYQIRITPAGSEDVVYDSGTVNLPDGADLMIAATTNVGSGSSPVTLLAADGEGSMKIWDAQSGANLRVVHGSPDAPDVDVLVNNADAPIHYQLDGLSYPNATDYLPVTAADLLVDVVADADNSIVALDDIPVSPATGMSYTAIATNTLANINLALLADDNRALATAAKVRLIHNSPTAADVDIYVTATDDISASDPAFAAVPYNPDDLATTGYVQLDAGVYYVTITPAGSKDAAIGPLMVEVSAGDVLSAIAMDASGGGAPLQAVIVNDKVPEPVMLEATETFSVNLSGAQEVPAVMTDASASATVALDEDNRLFSVSVDTSNVENVTGVHVHDGDIGMNGPVAFALSESAENTYTLDATNLLDDQVSALKGGEWYINVHTDANPDGEVRGQILPDGVAIVTFPLSGDQEIPRVDTAATGSGYATLDVNTLAVKLVAVTSGVEDATMAHIHAGYAGENGGVYVALEQHPDNFNVWMTPDGAMLDEANAAQLLEGGHYVNVHTPANPSGELRGQITPANIEVYGVVASGDQEVPAVETDASGVGAITLNTSTMTIKAILNLSDISPNAGHIHAGNAGENGPVVVALENPEAGLWTLDATLTSEQMAVMQADGLYTNFHTDAFPDGEIRGQITLGFE
ncbi:CHRD domain-containing protein [Lacimicrobium sp. SS2-24]|uniref:CHRD domain-containing protein n=1 Tax=Lacimicrobium sp. SS2-24 TaxID=2005569 RepID=UPI000B4BFA0A|nr:CHRD domain-containing protein [Lacimicrobium sp. SS2-24]